MYSFPPEGPALYRFLIEKANGNYSAYCPDLPGCIATGKTREETERNMYEAVQMHIRGMIEDSMVIPENAALAEYIAVAA
jgi:predicted RNase H-like HicB family nuclease